MKKTMKTVLAGLFAAVLLVSCGTKLNEQEKQMVGAWSIAGQGEDDTTDDGYKRTNTIESMYEYYEDHTLEVTANYRERIWVNEPDYNNIVTITYAITNKGKWSISGHELTEKIEQSDIQINKISTATKKDQDFDYMRKLKMEAEDEIPAWKNDYLGSEKNHIISLTDEKFIGHDGEGEEYEMVRVR